MYIQVLLGFFGIYLANGFPQQEYYLNTETAAIPKPGVVYNYDPRSVYYYPNDISRPIYHQSLGLSPQYHNLVFNYVKDFAGTEPPVHVNTYEPHIAPYKGRPVPEKVEEFGATNEDKLGSANGNKEPVTETGVSQDTTDKPGLKDFFLPSDFLSLANRPDSQFYGHFDAIKMKRMNLKARPTALPPIGGVVSNYALLRNHPNSQNLLQFPGSVKENEYSILHIKRQIPNDSDGVVIYAEQLPNGKQSEGMAEHKQDDTEENKEDDVPEVNPGIAQSKPSAIALVGPGGVAQASPVGTALVGQGGLAVAAPSGTAVAGPAGQGVINVGHDKQKSSEKKEESDSD